MKKDNARKIKVWRRKVATLAAFSRRHTVSNCTIPKVDEKNIETKDVKWGAIRIAKGLAEWNIPKEGYPQSKILRKKYKKKYYNKDGTIRKIVSHTSDYAKFPDHTFYPKGQAWFMEQIVQHKVAKWEKKNPCPIKKDDQQGDLFEEEFLVPWKQMRENAIEKFRNAVVSIYDKLPLVGRFEEKKRGLADYKEELVAEIKDKENEGHKINELKPNKSTLLKKAQQITNKVHAKRANMVCTNLKDHKRTKGRIILPQAA
jgi:hypothetical protein